MLENFENKFLNINYKTKLQLYILPLLLFVLFYQYKEVFKEEKIIHSVKENKKEFKESFLELFSKIEILSKNYHIEILSIKKNKKEIHILFNSSIKNFSKFIFSLENLNSFTSIKKVKNEKSDKSYLFEVILSVEEFYLKNLEKIKFEEEKEKDFSLNAIIGSYVVIDDKMLKIGDKLDDFKVIQIENKNVYLKKKEEILKLELKNEEFTKHFN